MPSSARSSLTKVTIVILLTLGIGLHALGRPADALAGSYWVHGCDSAGGAQSSWGGFSTTSAYQDTVTCPTNGNAHNGITTSVIDSGLVGLYADAGWQASAPYGTTLSAVNLTFAFPWYPSTPDFSFGLNANNQLMFECGRNFPACQGSGSSLLTLSLPSGTTALTTFVSCQHAGGCNTNTDGGFAVAVQSADVQVTDDTLPVLTHGQGLWANGGWVSGSQPVSFDASDNSGIQDARIEIDPGPGNYGNPIDQPHHCDYSLMGPCPEQGASGIIDTTRYSDGPHVLNIAAEDAAGNWASTYKTIYISNMSPPAPQTLNVIGGQGWRQTNSFDLVWQTPASADQAPLADLDFHVCNVQTGACRDWQQPVTSQSQSELDGVSTQGNADETWQVALQDAAGNVGPYSNAIHLRYDGTVPGHDALSSRNGWISAHDADSFAQQVQMRQTAAVGPSGIAGYALSVDMQPGDAVTPGAAADPTTAQWLTNYAMSLPEGVHTVYARAISGAGVPSDTVDSTVVQVDRTPPTVTATTVDSARPYNHPVTITITGADQPGLSGMAPAPAGQPVTSGAYIEYSLDGGAPVDVPGASATVTVGSDGQHALAYRAYDLAGNPSAIQTNQLTIDQTPPIGGLAGIDGNVVRFHTAETCLQSAQIQYSAGGQSWTSIQTTIDGGDAAAALPDLGLDHPAISVRGLFTDCAGNSALLANWLPGVDGGGPAVVVAPSDRQPAQLRWTVPLPAGAGALVRRGQLLHGTLLDAAGHPLPGATITVSVLPRDATTWLAVGSLRTDVGGRFSYAVPAGPSRTIQFAFAGDVALRPAAAAVTVRTPAVTTLAADYRAMRVGQVVTFSGRLLGGYVPARGALVVLEAFDRAHWVKFATAHASSRGRWTTSYRIIAGSGSYVYRIRVLVPLQQGYPYQAGGSRRDYRLTVSPYGPVIRNRGR